MKFGQFFAASFILLSVSGQSALGGEISAARWTKIKIGIANDIDALVSDTVNEGENQAFVLRRGAKQIPVMSCKNKSIPDRRVEIIFCEVTFKVRPYQAPWTQRTCDLTYVLHTAKKPSPFLQQGHYSIFTRCLETLSDGE